MEAAWSQSKIEIMSPGLNEALQEMKTAGVKVSRSLHREIIEKNHTGYYLDIPGIIKKSISEIHTENIDERDLEINGIFLKTLEPIQYMICPEIEAPYLPVDTLFRLKPELHIEGNIISSIWRRLSLATIELFAQCSARSP